MKKMILSVVAIAASIGMMNAAPTATVNIKMTSANNTATLLLVESAEYSSAFDNGFDSPAAPGAAMYAVLGGNNLSKCWTNNLDEVKIAFNTTEEVTLTFSGVKGRTIKFWDGKQEKTAADGVTMTLTPTATTFITINDPKAAPATAEICHQYDKLTVNNAEGSTVEVLDGTTSLVKKTISATDNEIDLTTLGLTKGNMYNVVWVNGEETKNLVIKF